jgi:shikimate dehydrogenase
LSRLEVDRYAVFGNPIQHSKSPQIHSVFAAQTNQAMEYCCRCIPIGHFKSAADQFFADGGKGLNITVPFKLDAYHYAQQLTKRAQQAGAVNTLTMKDQVIIGDNTDGIGLLTDIRSLLGWRINNARVLVMGAGGAVRGVLAPLLNEQPNCLLIVNRDKSKAQQLVKLFTHLMNTTTCDYCSYEELNEKLLHEHKQPFDIIINGTSASLNNQLAPMPDRVIHSGSYCYDMVYRAESTTFLQWAQQRGAALLSDGLGMLVCQAAESFYQWRGVRPDVKSVIRQLRLLAVSGK